MTNLYLAIPCYNEEEVLRDSAGKLLRKYVTMMAEPKITFDRSPERASLRIDDTQGQG